MRTRAACPGSGSFGQDNGRSFQPPWVRLAKTPRDSSSHNQGECDSALIVNNRKIYNDFSAAG
jgi:hypothetical protein